MGGIIRHGTYFAGMGGAGVFRGGRRVRPGEAGGREAEQIRSCSAEGGVQKNGSAAEPPDRSSSPSRDTVHLSQQWRLWESGSAAVQGVMDHFKKLFTQAGITLTEDLTPGDGTLAQKAAAAGEGLHLIVSGKFLDHMAQSEAGFQEGTAILSGMLELLRSAEAGKGEGFGAYLDEGGAAFWTAAHGSGAKAEDTPGEEDFWDRDAETSRNQVMFDMLEEMNDKRKSGNKLIHVSGKSIAAVTATAYARLARASDKAQVKAAMSDVQRSIFSLKITAVYGEDEQRLKARMAIRSLQKLFARGSRKIRRFDQEKLIELRKRKAVEKNIRKKEEQLAQELKKKRMERRVADRMLVAEGMMDAGQIRSFGKHRRSEWEEKAEEQLQLELPGAGTAACGAASAAESTPSEGFTAGAGASGFAAADVTIYPRVSLGE